MRIVLVLFMTMLFAALIGAAGGIYIFYEHGRGLPEYRQLADYDPPNVTRVHAGDGRLLTEFATERRVFVPIQAIPKRVADAFLSAEDKNFYSHFGVDPLAMTRAAVTNVRNIGTERRPVGASTITQQVAKNFLLTSEVSLERKIREAILAMRIERTFTKDRILELYLNEIYLGSGSYGVAAAALNYFNKPLDELTISEAAYLAALPKAPNNYHPARNYDAAMARRDWVIGRMLDDGRITEDQAEAARGEPLLTRQRDPAEVTRAAYFAEEVRREVHQLYGQEALYKGGLSVRTTVDPDLQRSAETALRDGLITYDRRHGWRGAHATLALEGDWEGALKDLDRPKGMPVEWQLAAVLEVTPQAARIGFADDARGTIPMEQMAWARPWVRDQRVGRSPEQPADVLSAGDVVLVEAVDEDAGVYSLEQVPAVEGAIVAMDPHTGRVLAMQGGFSFAQSEFNRATQAMRQPGSAFKPFVYLTALEEGFTPATVILDAPFVLDQGPGLGRWRPANFTRQFYGPTAMRVGIEQSRNLMTVRLAQSVGVDRIAETAQSFGIYERMPQQLSMALGAGETTLLDLTTAYGMLVNGGKEVVPTFVDRIQDRQGRTIFKHDDRPCEGCRAERWEGQAPPEIPDERRQVTDPASAYQIVSMLEGAVQRGTGQRINAIGKPVAGKTGTTNDNVDTWFIGFTPDLVAGVFVGFDEPRTLGARAFGSNVAGPIFKDFMERALEDQPGIPFRTPSGIRMMRMDLESGQPAHSGSRSVILEAFKAGQGPQDDPMVIDGGTPAGGDGEDAPAYTPPSEPGASGLY